MPVWAILFPLLGIHAGEEDRAMLVRSRMCVRQRDDLRSFNLRGERVYRRPYRGHGIAYRELPRDVVSCRG